MNRLYQTSKIFKAGKKSYWGELYGSSEALVLAEWIKTTGELVLVIVDSVASGKQIYEEILFYKDDIPVIYFPDYEVLAYDNVSVHQDIIAKRIRALAQIQNLSSGIVVSSIQALAQRLCPKEFITKYYFSLNIGDNLNLKEFAIKLIKLGYYAVSMVREVGEFSIRGSLLDLFPIGAREAIRLDLLDDEIESIRTFDVETQLSTGDINYFSILPAREFATSTADITIFEKNYRHYIGDKGYMLENIKAGYFSGGVEFYLPLFFACTNTFFDYIKSVAIIISKHNLSVTVSELYQEIKLRYEQAKTAKKYPLVVNKVFLTEHEILAEIGRKKHLITQNVKQKILSREHINYKTRLLPAVTIDKTYKKPLIKLLTFIQNFTGRILFVSESLGRQTLLGELLLPYSYKLHLVSGWHDFNCSNYPIAGTIGKLKRSLLLEGIAIITERELFGETLTRQRKYTKHKDFGEEIKNLVEVRKGDAVVHEKYGVGHYLGLSTIKHDDILQEFLTIVYAHNDKLLVPIAELDLVSRYVGVDSENIPLNRLGSKKWENTRKKVVNALYDIATELLELYAKRASQSGFSYPKPSDAYDSFVGEFSFEETADQLSVTASVLDDMLAEVPMDRVICGDVGFGKTEVAMRAAFLAVEGGKQVALLVPTTLLAEQHHRTFIDRFAKYPVRIESLSRFQSVKEQKNIINDLATGKVDIVIGTHKLIEGGINYDDLGLIIIDEEHRFGVRQKEKLKKMRTKCDVLAMSATPIPRTLNMALGDLRALSIIATPPKGRVAIKTFVSEWSDAVIKEACLRELHRAGQVFILHNDVKTIAEMTDKISALIPQAKIGNAHGKMPTRQLEEAMHNFYHQRFNILICSTIIETGIDIPSANTIIINNAQNFGLAQLHQLRGRVGRSHHKAYAYLIIKPQKSLTPNAKKRLQAIESLEELGAGFMLASHDLEIRGAGELLGEEQSGRMQMLGFHLYHDLLKRTIETLKSGQRPIFDDNARIETKIDSGISCIIPEHYLPDAYMRLVCYKRIANAKSNEELELMKEQMIDRFGKFEESIEHLFASSRLKLLARELAIASIIIYDDKAHICFLQNTSVPLDKIINLLERNPKCYHLKGQNTLVIIKEMPADKSRIELVLSVLKWLKNS